LPVFHVLNMSAKRQSLTLATKLGILKDIDNNVPYSDIQVKHGLKNPSNITRIKNQRKELEQGFKEGTRMDSKSLKKGKYQSVEKEVVTFVNEMTDKGVNVTLQAMEVKAKQIIEKEGIVGLKGGRGYLERVMQRNKIVVQVKHGDATSVNQVTVDDWKKRLKEMIKDYNPNDVFNADELGLFYGLLPSKTIAVKGKKLLNGKASKVRVTVLVGANMSGTEKLPLLVIGKYENPRCFKGKTKPLRYESNSKAWMRGDIFERYLDSLDRQFTRQNRKVILFVDNCPAHPEPRANSLKNIKIEFFPANCTSVLQPMDQGVIRSFKSKYRVKLLTHIIQEVEGKNKTASDIKVDMLMVMNWSAFAWGEVTRETINNCFVKAFFVKDTVGVMQDKEVVVVEEDRLPALLVALGETVDANDYVAADDSLIAFDHRRVNDDDDGEETEIDSDFADEGEDEEGIPEPSWSEAATAMEVLTRKFYHHNFVGQKEFDNLQKSFLKAHHGCKKQAKMTDYFVKK
jgi:DDE superfamily endonuclease